MKKNLSGSATIFNPIEKKTFTIISWNVLSEELTEAVYDSISPNGTPLFSKSLKQNRITYIKDRIEFFIKKYKYPVFCLQEVNDSFYTSQNIGQILIEFLKTQYYRVVYQSFGTFNPIYPELGVLTAVPLQHFDVIDIHTRQILPDFPNCFIAVTIRPTTSLISYTIVNTHFPAKFYDEGAMKKVSVALHSLIESTEQNKRMILCGDFNTSIENSWYPFLLSDWKTVDPVNPGAISTVSIQRRDKRVKTNTRFDGRIDHIFYKGRGLQVRFLQELPTSSTEIVLPTQEIPSDHFPLIMSIS